jgi:sialic acid synthase SpsE
LVLRYKIEINSTKDNCWRAIYLKKMGKMIVAGKDFEIGHTIKESDLEYRSPAIGIPPSMTDSILGKKIKRSIRAYEAIHLEDLE